MDWDWMLGARGCRWSIGERRWREGVLEGSGHAMGTGVGMSVNGDAEKEIRAKRMESGLQILIHS